MSGIRGLPVLERPPESSPAIADAKPRRAGRSFRRKKRSGGSLAAPALVPYPKAACGAARIGPMRCRERWTARRASRRRGESEARTASSAAAMMLGRQIPIADETVQRRHAPEPARPVAVLVSAVTSVRRMGVTAGGDLGALRCQHRGADTSVRDDARQSALAMSIGTAAERVGAENCAAAPGADAAQSAGLSRIRVGSGSRKRGERLDRRDR